MNHRQIIQGEFTRQAETFRASPTLTADCVTSRVGAALGPGTERALDIACGPGILLPTLSEHATFVVGLDLTHSTLVMAREMPGAGRVHLVQALGEQVPFADGVFDAVVVRLAIHHFRQPEAVLEAARSLMRPTGRLVVLDALAPADPARRELRDAIERLRDPSHATLVSRTDMAALIERAGFTLREETCWSQPRAFGDWAGIMNAPRRMAALETGLRALCQTPDDQTGLDLREEDSALWLSYDWGLFVADAASS